jgi:tetratricopeptide (TPR) repeat protein
MCVSVGFSPPVAAVEWLEVRSPHFVVVTDAGETRGRQIALGFEEVRAALPRVMPTARTEAGRRILILAARDEAGLRELIPHYWEEEGSVRPAGVFVPARERLFVALRADQVDPGAYHVLYHEYLHALLDLSFQALPVWLNEGLAEFYAGAEISKDRIRVGVPHASHVSTLRARSFIPLEVLLEADGDSPLYRERRHAGLFYAQSWALTHFLYLGEDGGYGAAIDEYLRRWLGGESSTAAARAAFGDLEVLDKKVRAYMQRLRFGLGTTRPGVEIDADTFRVRSLSTAEALAARGSFAAWTGRKEAALTMLAEALRLDPDLADAHLSLAFLELTAGRWDAAGVAVDRAVALAPGDHLVHFLSGVAGLGAGGVAARREARASFERAIRLQPDFAPAYAMAASLVKEESRASALELLERALKLEPAEPAHRLAAAEIFLEQGELDRAGRVGRLALAQSREPEARRRAEAFLERVASARR